MSDTSMSIRRNPASALVFRLSAAVAAVERYAASALIAGVALLILLNVFTRYAGYAIYWVDELAIYTMVWSSLVAGSLSVRKRMLISVTLILDFVNEHVRRVMVMINDVVMLVFAVFLIWLCWIWFNPAVLISVDFDPGAFVMETGNFIYGEPTNTLGIRKIWLWLIMPVFAVTMTIHSLANVIETFTTREAQPHSATPGGDVE